MRVRENLSSVVSSIGKNNSTATKKAQVGKVYGVVTTENTPTEKQFKKAGGYNGIGTVFYLEYDQSKNVTGSIDDDFLNKCKLAKPLHAAHQYFPLLHELIYLEDLASVTSQISKTAAQKYYISAINLWGNNQQNSQPASSTDIPGITFTPNSKIKNLLSFEGDHIIQGRQGNALRFSTTTKLFNKLNNWSSIGNEYDPITILSNGFAYDPNEKYHVEQINKDASSIYLTSTQILPLETDKKGVLNPVVTTIDVAKYSNAQIIINSDRVVLNSKKDEVMIFAKTNINLNTKNIINLNADERIHLNGGSVFLGTINNQLPTEPLVLGEKLNFLLLDLMDSLHNFGVGLAEAIVSPEGSPAMDIVLAANDLCVAIDRIEGDLEGILSQQNYTA
jgi:hypothetical protein